MLLLHYIFKILYAKILDGRIILFVQKVFVYDLTLSHNTSRETTPQHRRLLL